MRSRGNRRQTPEGSSFFEGQEQSTQDILIDTATRNRQQTPEGLYFMAEEEQSTQDNAIRTATRNRKSTPEGLLLILNLSGLKSEQAKLAVFIEKG